MAEADKTIPSYHVPREKALAELNSFLADVDADNTTQVKDAQGNPTDGDGPEDKHHYCKRYRMVLYDKPRILPQL